MAFAYFSFGLLIVLVLHYVFKFFATAEPSRIRQISRYLFFSFLILTIFFLFRIGLVYHAEILAFFTVVIPLAQRLLIMHTIYNQSRSRGGERASSSSSAGAMTVKEACEILEVDETATPKDIKEAHHRMIQKNHPDQGGSTYLASKINQARDVLLKSKKK